MRFKRLLFALCTLLSTTVFAGNNFTIKTVVIDAGHGGKDPGAIGATKTNEKDIALAVSLKLGDYIQKNYPGVNVIYTRKTDVFMELHERAELANQKKADLFICVHCNSNPNPQLYGTSTYVLGLHRTEANLEVAKRENSVILLEADRDKNYEFDPNSPEGHIIMSMKQNAFLDQSIDIASKIENQFENSARRKSLGVKQAGFYVLYKTTMPSLLSEIGFISNPQEEKFLNSDKGQDQIANALFKAFANYKFEMENSQGEQIAYEEAKKKSVGSDTGLQQAITSLQAKESASEKVEMSGQGENEVSNKAAETKTSAPPDMVSEAIKTEPDTKAASQNTAKPKAPQPIIPLVDTTVIVVNGKKIRKPVENASGGGVAEVEKPKETPVTVAVKEEKSDDNKNQNGNKEVQPVTKPVAKTKPPVGQPETKEVTVVKTEPKPAPVHVAPSAIISPSDIPVHQIEKGIVFKVQLFAVKTLKDIEFKKIVKLFPTLSTETIAGGVVRYYAGHSKTYEEAKQERDIAANHGYQDAFIVGFKDGVRMTPNQLKALER